MHTFPIHHVSYFLIYIEVYKCFPSFDNNNYITAIALIDLPHKNVKYKEVLLVTYSSYAMKWVTNYSVWSIRMTLYYQYVNEMPLSTPKDNKTMFSNWIL